MRYWKINVHRYGQLLWTRILTEDELMTADIPAARIENIFHSIYVHRQKEDIRQMAHFSFDGHVVTQIQLPQQATPIGVN